MSAASTVLVAVGMEVPTATDKTGLLEGQTPSVLCCGMGNQGRQRLRKATSWKIKTKKSDNRGGQRQSEQAIVEDKDKDT